jgi:hypothetical protein
MSKARTLEEFKKELKLIFPHLIVLGNYKDNKTKILIEDELGIKYNCIPIDTLQGHLPGLKSVVNRIDYFIRKSNKIHNNKYDYSKVNNILKNNKIQIICPIHGEFDQLYKDHIKGRGCRTCALEAGAWTRTSWKNQGNESKVFDGYSLYLLKLNKEDETFLKIGMTFRKVEDRIKPLRLVYNVDIVEEILGKYDEIYNVELYLKRVLKKYKYKPKLDFKGKTECFNLQTLNKLQTFFQLNIK